MSNIKIARAVATIPLCVILISGCAGDTRSDSDTLSSPLSPLEQFESMLDTSEAVATSFYMKEYAGTQSNYSDPRYYRHYRMMLTGFAVQSYDVRETDSLVSPYVAEATIRTNGLHTRFLTSKASVDREPLSLPSSARNVTIPFAYQEDTWVAKIDLATITYIDTGDEYKLGVNAPALEAVLTDLFARATARATETH